VRLFVGIELDETVRRGAVSVADALRVRLGPTVPARWVASDNLHITLWFIGEVTDDRATAILRTIDRPFDVARFDLRLAGLGAFPPSGHPHVFWIGVRTGAEALARIHTELAVRLGPLGLEPERRRYSAHLTIARTQARTGSIRRKPLVGRGAAVCVPQAALRADPRADVHAVLRDMPADAGTCAISWVTLFRSRLSPKGAAYEALLRVPLR
jgi:2'-5' RNA ligase